MPDLHTNYQQLIEEFVTRHSLPQSYGLDAEQWFIPLAEDLIRWITAANEKTLILGINGAQGTGKSTLSLLLATLLNAEGMETIVLSIDDFYLSGSERKLLSETVHPLLRSRGVPGTHDTALALETIRDLKTYKSDKEILLPRFNKAEDEPLAKTEWPVVEKRPKLIILEGWFIGAQPQSEEQLADPLNQLEKENDADGTWRRYVNQQLAGDYQQLFDQLDSLLMLKAPDFDQVYRWRQKQEDKLAVSLESAEAESSGIMDTEQVRNFIRHFERLSRHCLATVPDLANRVFLLNSEHRIVSCE